MIKIKYEKYYNDYINSYETKTFDSLESLADWLFGLVKGKYERSIWFVDPNSKYICDNDGKPHLDGSCIKSNDGKWTYWVELIEKDGAIIYSTGKFTNGICHWNDEVKQWLIACRERINNPVFNFG